MVNKTMLRTSSSLPVTKNEQPSSDIKKPKKFTSLKSNLSKLKNKLTCDRITGILTIVGLVIALLTLKIEWDQA